MRAMTQTRWRAITPKLSLPPPPLLRVQPMLLLLLLLTSVPRGARGCEHTL